MKKYIRFNRKEKQFVKMINQSQKGFELIILSESYIAKFIKMIDNCNKNGDIVNIVWQMKFKYENYILYRNCIFSEPQDNYYSKYDGIPKLYGKKIKIKCLRSDFFTDSNLYKGEKVKKTKHKFNDYRLLDRALKISELNIKSEEDVQN